MDKQSLIDKLFEVIALKKEDQVHENYKHVCDLAILYSQIISGKDIDCLLKQFVRREDDVMFEQRKNLTKQITPAICESIMNTYNELFRAKPINEVIDFVGEDVEDKITEVKEALKTIYGEKDIYKYLRERFKYLSFLDPNAFIHTTFDSFDPAKEKAKPFNVDISSQEAINYEYHNNILQWLISRVEIKYKEGKKDKDGYKYTIYGKQWAFVMTQVGRDYKAENGEEVVEIETTEPKGKLSFTFEEFEHKSQTIPLIIVGYKEDIKTEGATYVSPINPGMPFFDKLIKAVSEFDLTMCLHAFPQKTEYQDPCVIKPDGKCMDSGCHVDQCKRCNYSGVKTIKSAQDVRIFKLPKDKEDMVDLANLTHYDYPPIELLEFQDKIIDKWSDLAYKACFNAETFTAEQIAKLATGLNLDKQKVYNTLEPFGEKVSDVWEHTAKVTANYLDYKNPIADHAYPSDLKLKTIGELIDEMNKASSGGASGYIISGFQDDIIQQMYIDKPLELQKYQSKQKFYPFKGKTNEEIQSILMSNFVREDDVILYNYFETIFQELENEHLEKGLWFYDLAYPAQKEAIKKKIEEIKKDIGTAIEMPVTEVEEVEDIEPEQAEA